MSSQTLNGNFISKEESSLTFSKRTILNPELQFVHQIGIMIFK